MNVIQRIWTKPLFSPARKSKTRNIDILGEAARNIERHYPDYAAQHADVPWADIYLMRNRVAHGYFSVDFEIVWKTIRHDLPELAARVSALLNETP